MTLEIFLWALVAGLVGFLCAMVLAGLDDDPHTHDDREENPSPEPRDGEESHKGSPRQSKVAG